MVAWWDGDEVWDGGWGLEELPWFPGDVAMVPEELSKAPCGDHSLG